MKATVHTFAILKEKLSAQFDVEVGDNNDVAFVLALIGAQNPDCKGVLESCRVAVNEEFVSNDFMISEGTEIYLLPPSSGG